MRPQHAVVYLLSKYAHHPINNPLMHWFIPFNYNKLVIINDYCSIQVHWYSEMNLSISEHDRIVCCVLCFIFSVRSAFSHFQKAHLSGWVPFHRHSNQNIHLKFQTIVIWMNLSWFPYASFIHKKNWMKPFQQCSSFHHLPSFTSSHIYSHRRWLSLSLSHSSFVHWCQTSQLNSKAYEWHRWNFMNTDADTIFTYQVKCISTSHNIALFMGHNIFLFSIVFIFMKWNM